MATLLESYRCLKVVPPVKRHELSDRHIMHISSALEASLRSAAGEMNAELTDSLRNAIARISSRIVSRTITSEGINSLVVFYNGDASLDPRPRLTTPENYILDWTRETITLTASSLSGVIYGLETLSQMAFHDGALPSSRGSIRDEPKYRHRGLLVDSGRRFWPLELLKQTVDGLSAFKMNVLHYHFTDNCRFAIQSDTHPELVPEDGQFLTKDQVRELIAYAHSRGVRIIPEIDLPGHARGMRRATGVTWADEDQVQFSDSPGTRAFLGDILTEFALLFPDEYFHIGADETSNAPAALIEFAIGVLTALGKKVIGWEESYFRSRAGSPENLTIQLWKDRGVEQTDAEGFQSLYSNYRHFYLDLRPSYDQLYLDISPRGRHSPNLLGGEIAIWTDNYCPKLDCYVTSRPLPPARALFVAERDQEFIDSINRMVWVKAAVASTTFWNYVPGLNPARDLDLPFVKRYLFSNFLIRACLDTPHYRCSELEDEPTGPLRRLAETTDRPERENPTSARSVNSGIYSIRYTSWGIRDPTLFQRYSDPSAWPRGDLSLNFVDSYYSTTAFTEIDPIVNFVSRYRSNSGLVDSTVYFIYDDAGKKDPVLFRQYIRRFFTWYNSLPESAKRDMGNVGIGLNIESLRPDVWVPVIQEEFVPMQSARVRLQIVLYEEHSKEIFQEAMRVADSVLVHISGEGHALASAITRYTARHASAFIDGERHRGLISLAIRHRSALTTAQSVYDDVLSQNRALVSVLNKRSFLLAHPWESL